MSAWTNFVSIVSPHNGTTSHVIDPAGLENTFQGTPFVPEDGRKLMAIVYGPSSIPTPPAGWTQTGVSSQNGVIYRYERDADGVDDTMSLVLNTSNAPAGVFYFEFDPDVALGDEVTQTGTASGVANPTLTVTPPVAAFAIAAFTIHADGSTSPDITWDGTNDDVLLLKIDKLDSAPDGFCVSICVVENFASGSFIRTPTLVASAAPVAESERMSLAATLPATEPPVNVDPPEVTGTARVGETLTVTPGTWSPDGEKTYQWQKLV